MKKAILIISGILLISEITECQWYQKYFHINDPALLSREQIEAALKKSKDGVTTGTTLTIIGSLGIISGLFLFLKDYPDDKYPEQTEMGKKFTGALLALVSIPTEIVGISLLKKNCLRKSEIEKFIDNFEMNLVITRHNETSPLNEPVFDIVPGVSLTIRF